MSDFSPPHANSVPSLLSSSKTNVIPESSCVNFQSHETPQTLGADQLMVQRPSPPQSMLLAPLRNEHLDPTQDHSPVNNTHPVNNSNSMMIIDHADDDTKDDDHHMDEAGNTMRFEYSSKSNNNTSISESGGHGTNGGVGISNFRDSSPSSLNAVSTTTTPSKTPTHGILPFSNLTLDSGSDHQGTNSSGSNSSSSNSSNSSSGSNNSGHGHSSHNTPYPQQEPQMLPSIRNYFQPIPGLSEPSPTHTSSAVPLFNISSNSFVVGSSSSSYTPIQQPQGASTTTTTTTTNNSSSTTTMNTPTNGSYFHSISSTTPTNYSSSVVGGMNNPFMSSSYLSGNPGPSSTTRASVHVCSSTTGSVMTPTRNGTFGFNTNHSTTPTHGSNTPTKAIGVNNIFMTSPTGYTPAQQQPFQTTGSNSNNTTTTTALNASPMMNVSTQALLSNSWAKEIHRIWVDLNLPSHPMFQNIHQRYSFSSYTPISLNSPSKPSRPSFSSGGGSTTASGSSNVQLSVSSSSSSSLDLNGGIGSGSNNNSNMNNGTNSTVFLDFPPTRRSSFKEIPIDSIIQNLHLPQKEAAKALGVSVSTLKRRFYSVREQIGIEKWPTITLSKVETGALFVPSSTHTTTASSNGNGFHSTVTGTSSASFQQQTRGEDSKNLHSPTMGRSSSIFVQSPQPIPIQQQKTAETNLVSNVIMSKQMTPVANGGPISSPFNNSGLNPHGSNPHHMMMSASLNASQNHQSVSCAPTQNSSFATSTTSTLHMGGGNAAFNPSNSQ
ncbi:hypothetical protein C9374_005954 [Naegleria lovaniensis]|uniref:RWP-RK domain-containing protein n=1 Tax=Naegleria lovaniensis TaxID=51637 RepID=A0AA88GPA9_NAELO|nr:uncharacterized protein C9374_005954 [Naegleria lovaniensis]KAG2381570.1 hypothetical protein C9374_005954 [Naegleria lovaniensis]